MKIDGNNGKPDCTSVRLEQLAADRSKAAGRGVHSSGDRVQISGDVEVVNNAVRLAVEAPEIRQDRVEQARQKLESGELGQDLGRLADALIDHILTGR
jgi:flagellar biosynthesis anti-sigma factor FlgM